MFDESKLDPKLVRKAKKDAAGPLGSEMAKFSLQFAAAVYFGRFPIQKNEEDLRNGTGSIIDFGNGPTIVTARHVIQGYRDWLAKEKGLLFQVGNLKIDPIPRIIYEDLKHDIIVMKINDKELKEINPSEVKIGKYAYTIHYWPPETPTDKDWVIFGGFPGKWRQCPSSHEIIFDSFSSGACSIASVSEDQFICHFERDYWVKSLDLHNHEELYDLGGLSGAPVFLVKKLCFVFIGIIYEFSQAFDLMCVTLVKNIKW